MQIEIIVEGEGLLDIEAIRLPSGANGKELIAAVAKRGGFPADDAFLFLEGADEPLDASLFVVDERTSRAIHHVHRARQVEVTVSYKDLSKAKFFRPGARVQDVLDWAVGSHGFNIDPAIAPEMELALNGQTTALPKSAHIGRFVHHPHDCLGLDLIRGVVPNGGSR